MRDLLRMDRYRMFRSKMFLIVFLLILGFSIASAPIERVFTGAVAGLAEIAGETGDGTAAAEEALNAPVVTDLAELIADPFAYDIFAMLVLLAGVSFFYADIEHGYIKNIAGQQRRRSYTVRSKFFTVMLSNLVLMLTSLAGRVASAYIVGTVKMNGGIGAALYTFFVRWLLLLAISTVLLFLAAGLGAKSLANVIAVLGGTGLLVLAYFGADAAIHRLIDIGEFSLVDYAPDQLLTESAYEGPRAVIVALVFIVVFLFLAVKVTDKRDVK